MKILFTGGVKINNMKNLNKHIQEALAEFEEKFPLEEKQQETHRGELDPEKVFENGHRVLRNRLKCDIKSFLSQKLRDISVKVAEECVPDEQKKPQGKCLNAESHLFGSCFECKKIDGFNSAISQMRENITKLKE